MKFDDKLENKTKCFADLSLKGLSKEYIPSKFIRLILPDDMRKELSKADITIKGERLALLGKYNDDTLKELSEENIASKFNKLPLLDDMRKELSKEDITIKGKSLKLLDLSLKGVSKEYITSSCIRRGITDGMRKVFTIADITNKGKRLALLGKYKDDKLKELSEKNIASKFNKLPLLDDTLKELSEENIASKFNKLTLLDDTLKGLSEENIASKFNKLKLLDDMWKEFSQEDITNKVKRLILLDYFLLNNANTQHIRGSFSNCLVKIEKKINRQCTTRHAENGNLPADGNFKQKYKVHTKTKDTTSGYSTDPKKKKKDEANKNQHGLANCNKKLQEASECRKTEIGSGHFTDTSEKYSHDNASQKEKNQDDIEKCYDEFQEATRYRKGQIGSGDLSDKPERSSQEITSKKDEKQHERGMYNDENQEGSTCRNTPIVSGNLADKPEKTSQDITGKKYDIKDEKNTTTYGGEYDASNESTDNISKRDKTHRKNKNRSPKDPSKKRNCDLTDIKNEKNTTTYGGEYDASDESTDNISKRDKTRRKNKSRSSKDPRERRHCDFADTRKQAKIGSVRTDSNYEKKNTVLTKTKDKSHSTDTDKKWKDKAKNDETKTLTYNGEDDSSNESSDSIYKKDKIKRRNRRHSSKMPREDRKCDISDIGDEKKTTTYREIYYTSNESSDSISKRDKIKRRKRRRSSKKPSENCDSDITDMVRYPVNGHLRTGVDIKRIDTACLKAKTNSGFSSDDYKKTQKDKANAWNKCIKMRDVEAAEQLLQNDNIPDQHSVNLACSKFGRKHALVKKMCKHVCTFIQKQEPENITNVWPSYRYVHNSQGNVNYKNDAIFVIITQSETHIDIEAIKMYKTHVRASSEISQESRAVNEHETRQTQYPDKNIKRKRKKIVKYLDDNIDDLLSKHSNITTISTSLYKSRNFKQGHGSFEENLCIVLYVHVKGYIPLHEDSFGEKIGEYDVDVRECVFTPLMCGPNEFHSILKMGLEVGTISTMPGTENKLGTIGTIWPENPSETRYFVTCAHVVMSTEELIKQSEKITDIDIFQPARHISSKKCGRATRAVYFKETQPNKVGVEAALVEIVDRESTGFEFPYSDMLEQLSLTGNLSNILQNGIYKPNHENSYIELIKYGCQSKVTKGKYNSLATLQAHGIKLQNQIAIMPTGDFKEFAEQGDSGAVVFEFINGKLYPTCMIEGGLGDGRILATPLIDVLTALRIKKPEDVKKIYDSSESDMDCSEIETPIYENDMDID